jgi:hypothetical protein
MMKVGAQFKLMNSPPSPHLVCECQTNESYWSKSHRILHPLIIHTLLNHSAEKQIKQKPKGMKNNAKHINKKTTKADKQTNIEKKE